jgi:MGT family glycosyltransferase
MSTIAYFGIPAHGHTNPSLSLIDELVRRGHRVYYYSTEEFKAKIESTGATFCEYRDFGEFDNVAAGKNLAFLYYSLIFATRNMLKGLLARMRDLKPDCVIHDAISPWGRYVAAILGIPAISSVTTFAYDAKVQTPANTIRFIGKVGASGLSYMLKARSLQNEMQKEYGVKRREFIDTMMNEEALNVVCTSRALQPSSKNFSPNSYAFVGPLLTQRKNDEDQFDYSTLRRPVAYVSMGTVWHGCASIDAIIEALKEGGFSLVVSGTSDRFSSGNGLIIKKHVNQLAALRNADVFISHGGMNSVNESLSCEVPLCLFPFQSEQEEVAKQVVAMKCGVIIKRLDKQSVTKAVSQIMSNSLYKENCKTIARSFIEAGGSKAAADRVEDYLKGAQ